MGKNVQTSTGADLYLKVMQNCNLAIQTQLGSHLLQFLDNQHLI